MQVPPSVVNSQKVTDYGSYLGHQHVAALIGGISERHPISEHFIRAKRVLITTSKNKSLRVCSTNLGFSKVRIMDQIRMYLVSAGRNEVGYRKVA